MSMKSEALRELDAEFDSADNRTSGRLNFDEYMRRRAKIERMPDAEVAIVYVDHKASSEPKPAPSRAPTAKPRTAFVSLRDMRDWIEATGAALSKAFSRRDGQIAALEARIKALEAQPKMVYRGVWAEAEQYTVGNFATHNGSVWYCRETTRERPGSSSAWQLAVKHGRDAR